MGGWNFSNECTYLESIAQFSVNYCFRKVAPNEKQIYYILSRLRKTRGSSDYVGKLQKLERKKLKKQKIKK